VNLALRAGTSVAAARRALARAFRDAGLDSPDLDARVLVGHALGLDHTGLVAAGDRPLSAQEATALAALAARRLAREPVSRIVGNREFWGLTLAVTPAVLVPRPETETIVEHALAQVDDPARILDLGTGSGALLLALLSECPNAFGVATDLSTPALETARANAVALGLAARAAFVRCDFGAALVGGFDLIVSNPPYIASHEIATLAPEVRDFDPRLALDGSADGLDAYRAIAADARRLLAPGGTLVLELGLDQAGAVAALLRAAGLEVAEPVPDLAGIPRAISARHPI
jgi:release factor glutamine methyltransferase